MGGTIDKQYPDGPGAYAFSIEGAASPTILNEAKVLYEVVFVTICKKDSQDILPEDREKLVEYIKKYEGDMFVITHGTDTLIETAIFLSQRISARAIITGSFSPYAMKGNDAAFNLGLALGAVSLISCKVHIAINGFVAPASQVKRDLATGNFYRVF